MKPGNVLQSPQIPIEKHRRYVLEVHKQKLELIIADRSMGSCRAHKQPVRLRRAGDQREPTIKHREFLNQSCKHWQILRLGVFHHSV